MSVRRNATYNIAGALAPAVFSLATVPPFLRLIGDERYGVLTVVWLVLGYFSLLDLGLGRAVAQRIASLREGPGTERAETFWTALILNVGIGAVGGLLTWFLMVLGFPLLIDLAPELTAEVRSAAPWLAASVPVATVSGVMIGALHGRERFLELNLIGTVGAVAFQLAPLLVAWQWGPALPGLVASVILARLATMVWMFASCRRHLPLTGAPIYRHALVRSLLRFGGWVTVSSILLSILTSLDRVLIGAIAGARAVTWYSVPNNLVQRLAVFPAAMASALFPRLAADDAATRARTADESLRLVVTVVTPTLVAMSFALTPFLEWWLGAEFAAESSLVGLLLLPGVWGSCISRMVTSELEARGQPETVAKAQLTQSVPYLLLLVGALSLFGIEGAAAVWSLRSLFNAALLFRLGGASGRAFAPFAAPGLLVLVALLLTATVPSLSVSGLVAFGVMLIASLVWAWRHAPESLAQFVLRVVRPGGRTAQP